MRAVVCQHAELAVVERPEPTPGAGQVRLEVLRCGICGSDLHARHGIDEWADMAAEDGLRPLRAVRRAGRLRARVLRRGRRVRPGLQAGACRPARRSSRCRCCAGRRASTPPACRPHAPGAYAEQVLVQESLMMAVPNGLPADVAALTEPMAVAWHAVRRGEVRKRRSRSSSAAGRSGSAVILMLKAKGVRDGRRQRLLARPARAGHACGADVVVDPAEGSPTPPSTEHGHLDDAPAAFELARRHAREARAPAGRLVARLAARREARRGARSTRSIFECVGVPGVIESIVDGAPLFSRVVVVGVCVGADRFTPAMAINKEIDLRFVLGYTPLEFRDTLHMLAEGKVDPRPMITGDGRARRRGRRVRRARRPRGAREDPDRSEVARQRRRCHDLKHTDVTNLTVVRRVLLHLFWFWARPPESRWRPPSSAKTLPLDHTAEAALPAPNAAIPSDPVRLAATLTTTARQLRDALGRWDPADPVPEDVTLLALHHQRILRRLTAHRPLADPALAAAAGGCPVASATRYLAPGSSRPSPARPAGCRVCGSRPRRGPRSCGGSTQQRSAASACTGRSWPR